MVHFTTSLVANENAPKPHTAQALSFLGTDYEKNKLKKNFCKIKPS